MFWRRRIRIRRRRRRQVGGGSVKDYIIFTVLTSSPTPFR
jgi:hypothetical protein